MLTKKVTVDFEMPQFPHMDEAIVINKHMISVFLIM